MVRRCCIESCSETDLTILAHRFPKGEQMALQWQNALNLSSIPLGALQQHYVVCTKHFSSKAYRNAISNSLNTTALPSLDIHNDNERIETTRVKDKSKNVPTRCHKSPSSVRKLQTTVRVLNREEIQPAKRSRLDIEFYEENSDIIETVHSFEEHPDKTDQIIQAEETYEELNYELIAKHDDIEQLTIIPDQITRSVQTEIDQTDREVQTDKIEEQPPKESQPTESKDDKLINLLYPEYSGKSKIELIKMIIERSQKIKSLEEEKQLIEDAMRKLL